MPSLNEASVRSRGGARPSSFAVALLLGLGLLSVPTPGAGQARPAQAGDDALRVYLDCSGGWRGGGHCNSQLYRQEIQWVHWVRQPQDAQLHIILTSQDAGAGNRYSLDFIGREDLEGMGDEYTYTSAATDVQDETVRGLLRTMRLGLVRYAAAAGFGEDLEIRLAELGAGRADAPGGVEEQEAPEEDPWNYWVFSIDGNFSYESEDIETSKDYGFGVNANRTTEEWKLNVRANGNFEREKFEIPDNGSVRVERNDQDRWSVSGFAVKSLGEHMGVGAELSADNSTQLNRELRVGFGTGVEYNLFPWSQSNRRQLSARYVIGMQRVQYQDTTIFDVLEETVYQHEVNLGYESREPWGNANIRAGSSQYLDRTDAWSFGFGGFVSYRLFRGLRITLNGEYRKVEDQIYLSREELSDEDIFLGRRDLPTESEIEFRVGLRYEFGSIFNNVVNERFGRGVF
jgi:hypothetical protein